MKRKLVAQYWYYLLVLIPIVIVSLLEIVSINLISQLFSYSEFKARIIIIIIIIITLIALINILISYITTKLNIIVSKNLTINFLDKYNNSSISIRKQFDDTMFYKVSVEDVNSITTFISSFSISILSSSILIIGVVGYFIFKFGYIGIYALIVISSLIIVMSKYGKKLNNKWIKQKEADVKLKRHIEVWGYNSQDALQPHLHNYISNRYKKVLSKYFKVDRSAVISGYNLWVLSLVCFLFTKIIIIYASLTIFSANFSIGDIMAIILLFELIEDPVTNLRYQLEDLASVNASIKRYEESLLMFDNISKGDQDLECLEQIEVKNFAFSYNNRTVIVAENNIFKCGDIIQICGKSGVGKTTYANVILNLEKSNDINIKYNDLKLNQLGNNFFEKNVLYFDQNMNLNDITIHQFFGKSKVGFDDNLLMRKEDLGMSSGEFQYFVLTKMFNSTAKIIIIDEMNSEIDSELEKKLFDKISLINDKIIFFISHKPEILQYCNKYVYLCKKTRELKI